MTKKLLYGGFFGGVACLIAWGLVASLLHDSGQASIRPPDVATAGATAETGQVTPVPSASRLPSVAATLVPSTPTQDPVPIEFLPLRSKDQPLPGDCTPAELVRIVEGFLAAFNRGDQEAVALYLDLDASFVVGGNDAAGGWSADITTEDLAAASDVKSKLLAYFADRHAHHEQLHLVSFVIGPNRAKDEVDIGYELKRQTDDIVIKDGRSQGKGMISCATHKIVRWVNDGQQYQSRPPAATTLPDAEQDAETYPSAPPPQKTATKFERHYPGTEQRACVNVNGYETVRSGEFIAQYFDQFIRQWQPNMREGLGKIMWFPMHWDQMSGLQVRVMRRDDFTVVKTARFSDVAGTEDGTFYPSGITLPRAGRWRLIATSGPDWGCFEVTVGESQN